MTGTFQKLYRALGPLAGGILLDTLDLATFGPFGLYVGWFVGLVVGWWIASFHDFGPAGKAVFAGLAALYLTMPMTELFPVATVVSAVARFRSKQGSK